MTYDVLEKVSKKELIAWIRKNVFLPMISDGKWKALHPNTKDIVEEPVLPNEWRICIRCGKEFKPRKGVRQLYCEANCQQEAATERRKESRRAWYRAYRERKRAEAAK